MKTCQTHLTGRSSASECGAAVLDSCRSCVCRPYLGDLNLKDQWLPFSNQRPLASGKPGEDPRSIRCIVRWVRRKLYPRAKTSCIAKINRRRCSLPSLVSSPNRNWSNGSRSDRYSEISKRIPFAFGSLPQHSGDFVLMPMCHVVVT